MRGIFIAVLLVATGCGEGSSDPAVDAAGGGGDAAAADAAAADAAADGSVGCMDGQGLAEGEHRFAHEGMDRRFLVRLPSGYSRDRAWPLLFALHPNGSSADYWDVVDGDRNIRGELASEAILIVTEAIGGNWRDYDQPEASWPARLEVELGYFDEIFARATTDLCIDEEAVYSMGFSGGGSFSGVLGCRREYIDAFAAGGAVEYFDRAECVNSPPAWITIGTEELGPGREAFRDFFRDSAGCAATSMPTSPSPCVSYDGCNSEKPVHYCQHPAGHIWPDFGTASSWAFLKQQ